MPIFFTAVASPNVKVHDDDDDYDDDDYDDDDDDDDDSPGRNRAGRGRHCRSCEARQKTQLLLGVRSYHPPTLGLTQKLMMTIGQCKSTLKMIRLRSKVATYVINPPPPSPPLGAPAAMAPFSPHSENRPKF